MKRTSWQKMKIEETGSSEKLQDALEEVFVLNRHLDCAVCFYPPRCLLLRRVGDRVLFFHVHADPAFLDRHSVFVRSCCIMI